MRKIVLGVSVLVICGSIVAIVWSCCSSSVPVARKAEKVRPAPADMGNGVGKVAPEVRGVSSEGEVRVAKPSLASGKRVVRNPERSRKEDWQEYTSEEEGLVDEIHKAAETEDIDRLVALSDKAVKSANSTLRGEMVDALKSQGDRVLPELLPFLNDSDEDVRLSATAAFEEAVLNMEEDVEKAKIIALAMGVLRNEDTIRELSQGLDGLDADLVREVVDQVLAGKNPAGKKVAEEIKNRLEE